MIFYGTNWYPLSTLWKAARVLSNNSHVPSYMAILMLDLGRDMNVSTSDFSALVAETE